MVRDCCLANAVERSNTGISLTSARHLSTSHYSRLLFVTFISFIVFVAKTGTIAMGIQQHYPRAQSVNEDGNYASLPAELSSFTSSTFEPRQDRIIEQPSPKKNPVEQYSRRPRPNEGPHELVGNRRKTTSIDVFGQNMENLVQLEEPAGHRKFAKSLDEIREETPKRHARSVLELDSLIMGLENNLQQGHHYPRQAIRRNQSFDHAR